MSRLRPCPSRSRTGDVALAMMVLFGFLLLSGSVSAPDPAAEVEVRAAFEPPVPGSADVGARAQLFGDREARLTIDVSAPSRRRIDLRARWVQLGSGLAAPLGDAIPVIVNEEIGPASRSFALRLNLPGVKRVSEFRLQFSSRSPGENAWLPAGHAALRIYPADLVQPLRSIGVSRTLLVLDPEGRLRSFLQEADVAFVDLSHSTPGTESYRAGRAVPGEAEPGNAVALWAKSGTATERRDSRRTLERLFRMAGAVVVLGGVSNGHPKMKLVRARNKTRVDVEMPLLNSLGWDPRSQLDLVEAVLLSISPEDPVLFDPEGGNP